MHFLAFILFLIALFIFLAIALFSADVETIWGFVFVAGGLAAAALSGHSVAGRQL